MSFIQPPFWAIPPSGRYVAPHAVSVVVTPPAAVLTLAEAKLRAGLEWAAGDPRESMLTGFVAAATSKVEQDTAMSLLRQTRDVYVDALPYGMPFTLPAQSMPLVSVTSVKSTDTSGVQNTLDPAQYIVDTASGRIGLALGGAWPSDLRPFQPIVIRIVTGYTDVAALTAGAPLLVHAVGLLTAHYATIGRDLASIDTVTDVPHGYTDAISAYVPVTLA